MTQQPTTAPHAYRYAAGMVRRGATILECQGKAAAVAGAAALRDFEGMDAVARFRPELGGWHVFVRPNA